MTTLLLRRANVSRQSGAWQHDDFDVFDSDRKIGRIYLADRHHEFLGLVQRCGLALLKAEYEKWQRSTSRADLFFVTGKRDQSNDG
jgi:hypothetical protein